MGKDSGIEYVDHTFNPWWGCTKISAGCTYCYAETWAKRTSKDLIWGPSAGRRFFKPKHFNDPVRWNKKAAEAGRYDRVMCGSMCDIFEVHQDPITNKRMNEMRQRVWDLIDLTPNLVWILVTKRPDHWRAVCPPDWYAGWPGNVWAMVTMETQAMAEQRMPAVEGIPAVRAISAEPLLGFIDPRVFRCGRCCGSGTVTLGQARYTDWHGPCPTCRGRGVSVDWIIAGGETGAKARPTHPDAVRDLLEFSLAYDVPFFFKQWGEWAPADPNHLTGDGKYMGKYRSFRLGKTGPVMARLGKKNAGKKLDGIEWTQTPPFNPPTPYSDLPL